MLEKKPFYTPREMVVTAIFVATIVVCAQISIPMIPVPFSLAILAVMLTADILNRKCAITAGVVYLLLGAIGIPVFSGFQGGFQRIAGPTGGFLIGYIALIIVTSMFISISHSMIGVKTIFIANLLGLVICYVFGITWLCFVTYVDYGTAFVTTVLPLMPFDIIKALLAAFLGVKLRKVVNSRF